MNAQELIRHQREAAGTYLLALFNTCRRRYVGAMNLVQNSTASLPKLHTLGVTDSVDFVPLLPFWNTVCQRYMDELFDPQMELLSKTEPQLKAFSEYIHWLLIPTLSEDDETVRNVLRAMQVLPCNSSETAVQSLVAYVTEMKQPQRKIRILDEQTINP